MKKMRMNGFLTGLICGAVLCGTSPVAQAAVDWVQAKLSPQEIYLDGQKVDWTVYNVADQNYVRLADLCPEIGVGLAWDPVTGYVLMNSDGTTPEVTKVTAPTTSNTTTATVTIPSTTATSTTSNNGVITIPEGDAKLNLQVGDKILCDDGYVMEITDMSRYENNSFQTYDKLPALPSQVGDWNNLPVLDTPEVTVTHFYNENRGTDTVYITNVYEMRRMQYTIYNLIVATSRCWDGTTPLSSVGFGFDSDLGVSQMWPWKESEIVDLFNSSPLGNIQVYASDQYQNGAFVNTIYYVRGW